MLRGRETQGFRIFALEEIGDGRGKIPPRPLILGMTALPSALGRQ